MACNTEGHVSTAISDSCVWSVYMVFDSKADFDFDFERSELQEGVWSV